jgi:hypothetical protein
MWLWVPTDTGKGSDGAEPNPLPIGVGHSSEVVVDRLDVEKDSGDVLGRPSGPDP